MDIYSFCTNWVEDHAQGRSLRVLDYGCGAGVIVKALRERGFEAFGCDVFYDGGDYSTAVDPQLLGSAVLRMEGGRIPFDAESFDVVVNNQVLEHVEDLDAVVAEMRRVLRPDGVVFSIFPDAGVWREGHCGIPFLHWFPKGSRFRVYYAATLRAVGLGYHTSGKSMLQWAKDFCEWLDKWTYYRSHAVIAASFGAKFGDLRFREEYFLHGRLGAEAKWLRFCSIGIQRWLVRKLGGLVFEARIMPRKR